MFQTQEIINAPRLRGEQPAWNTSLSTDTQRRKNPYGALKTLDNLARIALQEGSYTPCPDEPARSSSNAMGTATPRGSPILDQAQTPAPNDPTAGPSCSIATVVTQTAHPTRPPGKPTRKRKSGIHC